MTSRLHDVLTLTVGGYLLLLGVLFLLDSTGTIDISRGDLVLGAIGLALIALGVLAILAAIRVRRFSRRLRRAVGHVRGTGDWAIDDDAVIQTVFGDIALNLADYELPEGDIDVTLLCWVGQIQVRAPQSVGLDVTAQAMIGTIDVLGVREDGVIRDIHVRSAGFDEASKRVHMRLSTFVGELMVVQVQ
jgi:lia operon protein LiaF